MTPERTSHRVSQHHTPKGLLEVGLFFTLTLLILRIVLYPLFSLVGVECRLPAEPANEGQLNLETNQTDLMVICLRGRL